MDPGAEPLTQAQIDVELARIRAEIKKERETEMQTAPDNEGSQENGQNGKAHTIALRVGRALNLNIRTKHAIGFVSLAGLSLVASIYTNTDFLRPVKAETPTSEWRKSVDEHIRGSVTGYAKLEMVAAETKHNTEEISAINTQVWWLNCAVVDQWRWEAIKGGNTDRARYLALKLQELGRTTNKECR